MVQAAQPNTSTQDSVEVLFFSQIVFGFQPPTATVGCKKTWLQFFSWSSKKKKLFGLHVHVGLIWRKNGLQVVGVAKV